MTPRLSVLLLLSLSLAGSAGAADPVVGQDQAVALWKAGKPVEALHAFEAILASDPQDPTPALYGAGMVDLEAGNWRAAEPYIKRLVKLRPSSFQSWEAMIQVYQASGERQDRDDAIRSLYSTWRSALDPAVRARVSFARDRIIGKLHTVIGQETLDPGGDTIVRFLFQPVDENGSGQHLITVGSDDATNERWREDGTVSYGTVVYHLDTVEQLGGGQTMARPYAFYLEPPDYDTVRAVVAGILAGTVQPLSGQADPYWAGDPGGK